MYRNYLGLLFLFFTMSSCTTPERINNNLDSLFQHCVTNNLFNGHILVLKKGQVVYNKSFGNISFNSQEKITEHTSFRLASLSKQFTAVGIVDLYSKGLLDYDDQVVKYCPKFPYDNITVRHLLNHTSGLSDYQDQLNQSYSILLEKYNENKDYVTNKTVSKMIENKVPDLDFDPGDNFDYSNTGYVYLALIIDAITGESFRKFLNDNYFSPLGMTNSWVADTIYNDKKKAIGYKRDFIDKVYKENEAPEFLKISGDGGIYSSAQDLLNWFIALDAGRIVNVEELEVAYSTPMIGEEKGPYGFGWFVRKLPFNGNKALTHSGEFAGFSNAIFRDLDANTIVIMLSNNSHKVRSEINSAVVRILYGVPFDLPKISTAVALSDMIVSGNIEEAKEFYYANLENDSYDFSEKETNSFGYELLSSKKYEQAIEIFKWNVELHPESSNVHDSLGEAYLESGDYENALTYYAKAYKMDPKN